MGIKTQGPEKQSQVNKYRQTQELNGLRHCWNLRCLWFLRHFSKCYAGQVDSEQVKTSEREEKDDGNEDSRSAKSIKIVKFIIYNY